MGVEKFPRFSLVIPYIFPAYPLRSNISMGIGKVTRNLTSAALDLPRGVDPPYLNINPRRISSGNTSMPTCGSGTRTAFKEGLIQSLEKSRAGRRICTDIVCKKVVRKVFLLVVNALRISGQALSTEGISPLAEVSPKGHRSHRETHENWIIAIFYSS